MRHPGSGGSGVAERCSIKNGMYVSVVVQLPPYLLERRAVKAKKTTEISTLAKNMLPGVVSTCCILCWLLSFH